MALHHNPRLVIAGLLFYADTNNVKSYPGSGTTVTSLMQDGLTGTLTGNAAVTNGSIVVDGAGDYCAFGDNITISSSFSINVWVNGDATQPSTFGCIVGKGSTANFGNYGFYGNSPTNYVRFGFVDTGDVQREVDGSVSGATDLTSATWVNYCGVYDITSGLTLYRNTVSIATLAITTTPKAFAANELAIGARVDAGSANYFAGSVGPTAIYNRPLGQEEVNQNYNAHRSRFGL